VAQVADFPPGPAVVRLVFPSAGISPVSTSLDSSFSPAHELSARVAAGFHFALRSRSEVFVGFDLDFWICSSRYRLRYSSWSVPSFSRLGRTWSQSPPCPSALALVLSIHPGSLCKDSSRAFDFLRRLASPHAGLGRYLPQERRALR
jgi:hypothetical protein